MVPLFLSYACDRCEGRTSSQYDEGFVVWRGGTGITQEYVFRTRADAEKWRAIHSLEQCPIRTVLTEGTFKWRQSKGSIKDLEFADHLFEIYPDKRFEPGPHRAFLS